MAKISRSKKSPKNSELQTFLKDATLLLKLPVSEKFHDLILSEYPFDLQLLTGSDLYRQSRKLYLDLGGKYKAKVSSMMRSLSAQDLFKDEIEYSPLKTELEWFVNHHREVMNPNEQVSALTNYNAVSLYHEQNHRVVWQNLPPAPIERFEEAEFCRYLNFAESLVVVLDLALGDELGAKHSPAFERMKSIYRPGAASTLNKKAYRDYLKACLCATYFLLELYEPKDIPKGLSALYPDDKKLVKAVCKRSLELSDLFTLNTNQLWQERYWMQAQDRLQELHESSDQPVLYLPENPLDLKEHLELADPVFDLYGL